MPRGDATGPAGRGPMTGRAKGYCAGYLYPGSCPGFGNGFGLNRIHGFENWRSRHAAGFLGRSCRGYGSDARFMGPCADEKELLKERIGFLENELNRANGRLKEIEEE